MNQPSMSDQLVKPFTDISSYKKLSSKSKGQKFEVPDFLEMKDLKKIEQNSKSFDDYVLMANIILTNKEFFPKPPEVPLPEVKKQPDLDQKDTKLDA